MFDICVQPERSQAGQTRQTASNNTNSSVSHIYSAVESKHTAQTQQKETTQQPIHDRKPTTTLQWGRFESRFPLSVTETLECHLASDSAHKEKTYIM